ncbi:LYSM4 protein, partial [Nothoprocta ornata]|nr:LYSM4 protein [Nothoprocta pentlandii]NWY01483.1 LYSM4 protein [Nothoprocta ornata]
MRLKESRARACQAPVTMHSRVNVFQRGPLEPEQSEEEEEEEATVGTELRARGREQPRGSAARGGVVLLQRDVSHRDSLNKLALQYGCKVADIKRVNNFIREQDLYALKSIKIPVKNHGLLTEKGQELQPIGPVCPGAAPTLVDIPEASAESTELQDYFRDIDRSIEEAAQAEAQLDAEFGLEAPRRPPGSGTPDSGADCGIQWWNAVFVMLLIGVVLPVFYITYFKTQGTGVMAHNSSTTLTSNISADGLEGKVPQNLVTEEIPKGGIKPSRASPASTESHKPATLTVVRPGG